MEEVKAPSPGRSGMESRHESSSLLGALSVAAQRVAEEVGDGCVVRLRGPSGDFGAVAAEHRDLLRRDSLCAELHRPPLPAPGGWIGQALERGCVLRLPELTPAALAEAGLPPEDWIGDVLVVPLRPVDAVIVAVRDRKAGHHSFAHRLALERLAAEARRELVPLLSDQEADQAEGGLPGKRAEDPGLLDRASAGVWVIDSEGRTTSVNEMASELVGVPIDSLLGAPMPQLLRRPRVEPRWNVHADEESELEIGRPDGSTLWLSTVTRPLFDCDGEPSSTVVTLLPIGERKQREVELRMRLSAREAFIDLVQRSLVKGSLKAVMADAVELLLDELGASVVTVDALDLERHESRVLAAASRAGEEQSRALEAAGASPLSSHSLALAAIERAESVEVRDFLSDPAVEASPRMARMGMRSAACVRMRDDGAVLSAYTAEPQSLSPADLELMELVARWIAGYDSLVSEMTAGRGTVPHQGLTSRATDRPRCASVRAPAASDPAPRRGGHPNQAHA